MDAAIRSLQQKGMKSHLTPHEMKELNDILYEYRKEEVFYILASKSKSTENSMINMPLKRTRNLRLEVEKYIGSRARWSEEGKSETILAADAQSLLVTKNGDMSQVRVQAALSGDR